MMLVALFKSMQILMKLGDLCESAAIEADHISLTEKIQPEHIMMFWDSLIYFEFGRKLSKCLF